ncbi:hypothetical protein FOZ60_015719 [Perkinsus olseni]|uniref:Uncharacterized protein n=1 Tax=Perkinsus olseni TaxID=32597 RepID=A0A7J6PKZ8_PEROL|nr:hypothetical protein FOZ60_015719 [Perkinsus olseni]
MSRYCPSCHACILDFGNYTDQRHCDIILAPAANLGPPSTPPVRTGTPVSLILLALPLARELFAVQPADCRYLRLAFPCEEGGCLWTFQLWRKVIARALRQEELSYEDLTQRVDALRKRILDFQIEAAASLDLTGLMRKRAEIVKEGDSIVSGLGGEAPRLEWGEFPSNGVSSFAQDIACLSSIRQVVERYRTTQRSSSIVQDDNVGVLQLSTALKRLGAAKLARSIELEESRIIHGRPGPSVDAPLEQFREDVKSLRELDTVDRYGHNSVGGSEPGVEQGTADEHSDQASDCEVIKLSPKESIPEQLSDCALGNEESRRKERAEVIVASPVVRTSRAECVKEDMVRRIAEKISKVEATGQKNDEDNNVLSEYLQSTPVGRASCYGTGKEYRKWGKQSIPRLRSKPRQRWERSGEWTNGSGKEGSSAGKEMMRTENLVDYLPPLTDVSSTPSTLPMNLTMKTTASEELDRLADLRGKLALEAHREEEKRKKEEARRLADRHQACDDASGSKRGKGNCQKESAAKEQRGKLRSRAALVSGTAGSDGSYPRPYVELKKRLAKSLKMEAERKQREEEEKRKTQAEIFRKRDERISKYLARQREELQRPETRVTARSVEKRDRLKQSRRPPPDYSLTPPKTFPSYKASRPWLSNEAQARDFNHVVEDPIFDSPTDELPRSPRLPDSLASGDSIDIGDAELIDDLPISIRSDSGVT